MSYPAWVDRMYCTCSWVRTWDGRVVRTECRKHELIRTGNWRLWMSPRPEPR